MEQTIADDTIEHLSWVCIDERHRVLFVRAEKRDVFFAPGGRRESDVPDEEVLARKLKQDLNITVGPLELMTSFKSPAYGKEDVMVEIRCYRGLFEESAVTPAPHITEIGWFWHDDERPVSDASRAILQTLNAHGLIY